MTKELGVEKGRAIVQDKEGQGQNREGGKIVVEEDLQRAGC